MNTTPTLSRQFARAVAEHINTHMFQPHRGVIEVRNPFGGCRCLAAFGNDAYTEEGRTRQYADGLAHELAEFGLWDVELGVSNDGYTWAIVVPLDHDESPDLLQPLIENSLYERYIEARGLADDEGFVMLRKSICDSEILDHTGGEPVRIEGWESIN